MSKNVSRYQPKYKSIIKQKLDIINLVWTKYRIGNKINKYKQIKYICVKIEIRFKLKEEIK